MVSLQRQSHELSNPTRAESILFSPSPCLSPRRQYVQENDVHNSYDALIFQLSFSVGFLKLSGAQWE